MSDISDVREFNNKFNVPMAKVPSLLSSALYEYRVRFMMEELSEFMAAHRDGNLQDAADALIDLVYVVHGTALMMGLPWEQLWNVVHAANMGKRLAVSIDESKRRNKYDVVKPENWEPPSFDAILGSGELTPVFDPEVQND